MGRHRHAHLDPAGHHLHPGHRAAIQRPRLGAWSRWPGPAPAGTAPRCCPSPRRGTTSTTARDQGTAWRDPGFDDSGWASGNAELGYGDGDERRRSVMRPGPAVATRRTPRPTSAPPSRSRIPRAFATLEAEPALRRRRDRLPQRHRGLPHTQHARPGRLRRTFADVSIGGERRDDLLRFPGRRPPCWSPAPTPWRSRSTSRADQLGHQLQPRADRRVAGSDAGDFTLVAEVAGRQASRR